MGGLFSFPPRPVESMVSMGGAAWPDHHHPAASSSSLVEPSLGQLGALSVEEAEHDAPGGMPGGERFLRHLVDATVEETGRPDQRPLGVSIKGLTVHSGA